MQVEQNDVATIQIVLLCIRHGCSTFMLLFRNAARKKFDALVMSTKNGVATGVAKSHEVLTEEPFITST